MTASAEFPIPKELAAAFSRLGHHEQHEWVPLPFAGCFNKVLYFDSVTGATIELARIDADATFPPHYHTSLQTLFLVSGLLRTEGGGLIEAGTFNVIPAGQLHGPFFAERESIQFKYFSSVPVYVMRDGTTYIYRRDGRTISAGTLAFQELGSRNLVASLKELPRRKK